jgi:hypothetical protein
LSIKLEALLQCISQPIRKVDVFIKRLNLPYGEDETCSKIEKESSNVLEDVYFVQN